MAKKVKPFKIDGDEACDIVRWQSVDGPERIDVAGLTLKPSQARRLAKWLVRASNEVAIHNHRFNWRRAKKLKSIEKSSRPEDQLQFHF